MFIWVNYHYQYLTYLANFIILLHLNTCFLLFTYNTAIDKKNIQFFLLLNLLKKPFLQLKPKMALL